MLRRHSLNKKVRNSLENPRRSRKLPENHESKALGCPGPLHPRTAELSEAAPNPAPSKTATRAMPQAPQPPPGAPVPPLSPACSPAAVLGAAQSRTAAAFPRSARGRCL